MPRSRTLSLCIDEAAAEVWLCASQMGGAPPYRRPLRPGQTIVIGTSREADWALDDPTVSARHCRVTHEGGHVAVEDLGSRNGVRIGGGRASAIALGIGCAFELGRTTVTIEAAPEHADDCDGPPLGGLVGGSRPMRRLAEDVRRVAPLRLPVLLRGESGTGKDLVSRALHDASPRARGPFFALNAATVSRELAESELFGHARGAFTGATRDRRGAFREAHRGTLFLDEIAALSLEVQAKLLRVVEDGAVRPLGGEAPYAVDVRLVAATCEPLEALVETGRFRVDLYERLAACVVRVPPLRARSDDIGPLAEHLLAVSELGARELTPGALAVLRAQRWPGNVRELRNVVVQAALRAGSVIDARHVAAVLAERAPRARPRLAPGDALRIFEEVGGNVSAAARRAELPRSTMRDLLRAARVGGG